MSSASNAIGQEAPSAKRCIKTRFFRVACCFRRASGQKAPSAKRCIKTPPARPAARWSAGSQKAPSAKRCIKTSLLENVEIH